jgi:hypothetical protein
MLSAYSSGIAHAEQDVDTGPAEKTLAQLQKLEIVAQGATPSPAATSCVLCVVPASRPPDGVTVAYVTTPLDDVWRAALSKAGAAIVTV